MELTGNTVLITGGTSGIGLEIARIFLEAGSKVIVCGRRVNLLTSLKSEFNGLETFAADLAQDSERVRLAEWVTQNYPELNVLVNNAGIQERVDVRADDFWERASQEIDINLKAPIHLTSLLLPILEKNKRSAIINVTSGLAFAPIARIPVYCATKAGLHSFTQTLRHIGKPMGIEVIEIIPPSVNTDLGGVGLHTQGAPLDVFGAAVQAQLREGQPEITYGTSEYSLNATPEELKELFRRMNPET
jgi:uncharacterized oxidoreductase